jgi:hypothetical protein
MTDKVERNTKMDKAEMKLQAMMPQWLSLFFKFQAMIYHRACTRSSVHSVQILEKLYEVWPKDDSI